MIWRSSYWPTPATPKPTKAQRAEQESAKIDKLAVQMPIPARPSFAATSAMVGEG